MKDISYNSKQVKELLNQKYKQTINLVKKEIEKLPTLSKYGFTYVDKELLREMLDKLEKNG